MDDIQEINTDPSWHNVILTICVASAVIYFFFFSHDRSNSTSRASSTTLDKDERQKRRERLAVIAEKRRIALLKRDDDVQDKANTDAASKSVKRQQTKQKPEANDVVVSDEAKGQPKETGDVSIATEKVDDDSNNDENSLQISDGEVEQVALDGSSSALVGASSESCSDGKEETTANNTKSVEKEELDDKESSNKSTENNEDESVDVIVKEESRQRTQQAIAKLKASKKDTKKKVIEEEESSTSPKLLTIYLILTSCPGSSRLELSIPNNISTTTLLQQVSNTSRIAITDMKLIFRGRIINGRGKKDNAVDEYGIEEGCALHVMGKPTLPEVQVGVAEEEGSIVETGEEVDVEAADVVPNTYEEEWDELPAHVQVAATMLGYSPQLWNSGGEPSSEELYWEELTEEQRRAATILGYNEQSWNDDGSLDDDEVLLLIDRIRRSTGADMNGLREAVAAEANAELYWEEQRRAANNNEQSLNDDSSQDDDEEMLLLIDRIRRSTGADLNGLREAVAAGFSNILSVPDANGWTTLHEAIRAGNTQIIEYLVREVGLDLTAETNQGRNALSLAQDFHGEEGSVTLLIESLLQESEESTSPEE